MKNLITLFVVLIMATALVAQQDAQFTMNNYNQQYLNPAYTGTSFDNKFTLLYRDQWFNYFSAPGTQKITPHSASIGVDLSLKGGRIGVGGLVHFDHIGYTLAGNIRPSFSYIIPTKRKTHISLGVQADFMIFDDRRERALRVDDNDNSFTPGSISFNPNFGAGIYVFDNDRYYVGLGIPHILNWNLSEDGLQNAARNSYFSRQYRHYFIHAGMMFPRWSKSSFVHYLPSILVKIVEYNDLNGPDGNNDEVNMPDFDIMNRVIFMQRFTLGVGARLGGNISGPYVESIMGLFSVMLGKKNKWGHEFGFAYDYTVSDLQDRENFSTGSLELMYKLRMGKSQNVVNPGPDGQFIPANAPF